MSATGVRGDHVNLPAYFGMPEANVGKAKCAASAVRMKELVDDDEFHWAARIRVTVRHPGALCELGANRKRAENDCCPGDRYDLSSPGYELHRSR